MRRPVSVQAERGEWFTWGGTTLGHGGFYGPGSSGGKGIDTEIEFHEHVHVEQFVAAMIMSLVQALISLLFVGLSGDWTTGVQLALVLWVIGGFLFAAAGWLTAWLRGEDPYRGSFHEEAAYSLTREEVERRR